MRRTGSRIEPKVILKKFNPYTRTYGFFKFKKTCGTIIGGSIEKHELENNSQHGFASKKIHGWLHPPHQ